MNIERFGFSRAVKNTLRKYGLDTLTKLCNTDGTEILNWRKNGQCVRTELLQTLLQRHVRPIWYKTVGNTVERDVLKAPPTGWHQVLSECRPSEHWIIETTIADMERGGIQWAIVEGIGGRQLWRKGGVDIDPE